MRLSNSFLRFWGESGCTRDGFDQNYVWLSNQEIQSRWNDQLRVVSASCEYFHYTIVVSPDVIGQKKGEQIVKRPNSQDIFVTDLDSIQQKHRIKLTVICGEVDT